jgi:hypothetical protein
MNLTPCITAHKIPETYDGTNWEHRGVTIWSTYFERDYIRGIATDKIPASRFENDQYALRLAALLGRAAAPNMIVGRCDLDKRVVFDDGDEVVQEDEAGLPLEIVVSDQMGTFGDFKLPLEHFAKGYAQPVNSRLPLVRCPVEFADAYLNAFRERFIHLQQEYFKRKRAFDTLFSHERLDEQGNFRFRWEQVLKRLQETDAQALTEAIRKHINLPQAGARG